MIAAGGTGGHVYPALAVAEAFVAQHPQTDLHFIGSAGGFERPLLERAALEFAAYDEVRAGPLHGVNALRAAVSLGNLILGTFQALWLIARNRPRVLLLTGGWVGLPVALAAWLLRVPSLIVLPDIEPGLTIRVLRHFARRVAVTAADSLTFFRQGQAVVTGYPVRPALRAAARGDAVEHFGLDMDCKTLLVVGGSRGARSINRALLAILPDLLAQRIQVLHVTGTLDWPEVEATRAMLVDGAFYHAYPYLHDDMGLALAAADLVVSRAGASVLGELPLFGLPAILVPYPHAWRYQKVNADYLAGRGGAIRLNDPDLAAALLPAVTDLLHDAERLARMRAACAALAQPDAAWRVAQELLHLAGVKAR